MDSDEVRRIRVVYADRERQHKHKSDSTYPGRRRLLQQRDDRLAVLVGERLRYPLCRSRILDIGCGHGSWLSWFHQRGVPPDQLFGVDLLPHRIEIARETYPAFNFAEANAEQLAFPDEYFDMILVGTVFSSVFDQAMANNIARTIIRVLAQRGAVVWWDIRYPNPSNPNVRAMTKSRIRELFPSFELELESLGLLPPVAQRLGRLTDLIYPLLASIPVLHSHYFGLLRPAQHPAFTEAVKVHGP